MVGIWCAHFWMYCVMCPWRRCLLVAQGYVPGVHVKICNICVVSKKNQGKIPPSPTTSNQYAFYFVDFMVNNQPYVSLSRILVEMTRFDIRKKWKAGCLQYGKWTDVFALCSQIFGRYIIPRSSWVPGLLSFKMDLPRDTPLLSKIHFWALTMVSKYSNA